jgi:hypothetical protein
MAVDSLVSQELKILHEQLSASRKERAASSPAGAAPVNTIGPTADASAHGNELRDQLQHLADELKDFFEGAGKSISDHPARSAVGAMLVGILIGRLLGRR